MEKPEQPLLLSTATVADIALFYPHAVAILNRHCIDYCCDGHVTFIHACEARTISAENIWDEILETIPAEASGIHFEDWRTKQLIDFILEHHHRFIRQSIPEVSSLLDTVCSIHGEDDLAVLSVRDDFDDLVAELNDHLAKEESVLFPAIRRILDPDTDNDSRPSLDLNIKVVIAAMEQDHRFTGELLNSLRNMTRYYTPPDYACPTYRAAYQLLQDLDNDLVQHIHLENNILFPRVKDVL